MGRQVLVFTSEADRGDEAMKILRRARSEGFSAERFQDEILADRDPMDSHPICYMTEDEAEDAQLLNCVVTIAAQVADSNLES